MLLVVGTWLASDRVYLLNLAASFQWQLAGILVLLAAASYWQGRRIWGTALLLVAVLPGMHILPLYVPQNTAAADSERLRILSLNLLSTNENVDSVADLITRVDPDVINLIECTPQWKDALKPVLEPYSFRLPQTPHSTVFLCSRLPFTNVPTDPAATEPYLRCALGRLDYQGSSVLIAGVHARSPISLDRLRRRDEELILLSDVLDKFPGQTPKIVVGDFNADTLCPSMARLLRDTSLRDSRIGFGMQNSWPTSFWPLRICIDHCFVSEQIVVLRRWVERSVGSDHFPIVIDVGMSSEDR